MPGAPPNRLHRWRVPHRCLVRRWQHTITIGVTTLTWDLQTERAPGDLRDARPGSYDIEVRVRGARATGRVQVLPDPILLRR
jgi:hypothetical protein